jgi:hypothetical protein
MVKFKLKSKIESKEVHLIEIQTRGSREGWTPSLMLPKEGGLANVLAAEMNDAPFAKITGLEYRVTPMPQKLAIAKLARAHADAAFSAYLKLNNEAFDAEVRAAR